MAPSDNTRASPDQPLADRQTKAIFSADEEVRIADAITRAERNTSGEIVAVVARESDPYLYAPFMWAALIALLAPWPLIFFTWMPVQHIYLVQLIVFLILLVVMLPLPVRVRLVPKSVQRQRAHRRAMEQFLAQDLHTTNGRTGVLIFVSIAERYAELLADTGIDGKVAEGTWQGIVDDLAKAIGSGRPADGFVKSITAVGHHLAEHYPPGSEDANELPNHLIVI